MFNKEQDARRHGALITNRPKLQVLKKQRTNWIKNQKIAFDKEKELEKSQSSNKDLDYDLEKSNKIMQEKAKKYDAIMQGKSKTVNTSCLVDFNLKGIDVEENDSYSSKFDKNIAKIRHKQTTDDNNDKLVFILLFVFFFCLFVYFFSLFESTLIYPCTNEKETKFWSMVCKTEKKQLNTQQLK